jgi:hypothetical protein
MVFSFGELGKGYVLVVTWFWSRPCNWLIWVTGLYEKQWRIQPRSQGFSVKDFQSNERTMHGVNECD